MGLSLSTQRWLAVFALGGAAVVLTSGDGATPQRQAKPAVASFQTTGVVPDVAFAPAGAALPPKVRVASAGELDAAPMEVRAWVIEAPSSQASALRRAFDEGHFTDLQGFTGASLIDLPPRAVTMGETLSANLARDLISVPGLDSTGPVKGAGPLKVDVATPDSGYLVEVTPTRRGEGGTEMSGRLALRDLPRSGGAALDAFRQHELFFRLNSPAGEAVMTPFISVENGRVVALILQATPTEVRRPRQRG